MSRNVLLAAMSLDYGGAETHVVDLAYGLYARGHEVTVVSAGGKLVPTLETAGIRHIEMPLDSRSPAKLLHSTRLARRLLARRPIDIVHAHGRIPAWVFSRLIKHTPLVTTYHGVYAAGFPWNVFTVQGDRSIAVSEDIKEHFVRNFGFDEMRLRVVPNGIDTSRFVPGPPPEMRAHLAASDAPLIVHISRLDEFSNVAFELIEALVALDKAFFEPALVIVGDGYAFDEVARACERANARLGRKAATAVGGKHDVTPYLLSADVVVAVARAALEAMACGKPVVFAGEGGICGILSPENLDEFRRRNFTARGSNSPVTAQALQAYLSDLLDSRVLAERVVRLGRQTVTQEYSWDVLLPEIIAIYEEALAERRDPDAVS